MTKKLTKHHTVLLLCVAKLILLQGCQSNQVVAAPPETGVAIANPAAIKCVQEGYTQEILMSAENTPIGALCVNLITGQKCEEWAYFKGQCQLDVPLTTSLPKDKMDATTLANPATVKCLQDGYTWKAIKSPLGVPTGGLCINQETRSKCEEWAYFHGKCQFNKTLPKPPILPPHKGQDAEQKTESVN
jgi:putative hemolysin